MLPLLLSLAIDTLTPRRIALAHAESLTVTVTGAGEPVVLVPGLFGSAYGFRKVTPLLVEAGFQVIVIEPLAVGTSSRPRRADYSLHAQAARVAGTMDSLGLTNAVLVGHSVGAAIMLRVALARPDLARAIVSLEGGPAESAVGDSFRRAVQYVPMIRLLGGRRMIRRVVRQSLERASADASWVTDEAIAGYTAGATPDVGATLLAYLSMAEAREPAPLAPRLGELRCPVRLLLGGAPHGSRPGDVELARLRAGVPRLTVQVIEGAGHFLHEEAPADVARAVQAARAATLATR